MSDKDNEDEPMRVDTDLVKRLAEMLDENDLSEIEVEDNGRRIVVKRKISVAAAPVAAPAPARAAAPAPAAPAEPEAPARDPAGTVKSPMVGTVFLAGEPSAPPFVSVGDRVAEGDTLLIIEAMKVMNPIAAPRAGIVREILVQDAQPVEYEQPLAIID
ncbi:MAG TPA: acetyl-CoA carboxylase biotin carboxyl carrier protein [Allosphingosinicella sp.]|nr:acetyl-CoA carboxylase biotin carboxyl carrier protein [Allosphingosinicella sp.]